MVGLLARLLIAGLCVTLVLSTWWQFESSSVIPALHETYYRFQPRLREIRLGSTVAVLILCLLLARRDPLFTRVGILAVLVSLAIMLVPPREIHRTVTKIEGIKLETKP